MRTSRWARPMMLGLLVLASCATVPPTTPGDRPPAGPSAGCRSRSTPTELDVSSTGVQHISLVSGGLTRRALVQLPADYSPTVPAPLLISLHPFLLGPDAWEAYSHLSAEGAKAGDVVVTPEGSGPGPRWSVPGGLQFGVDDLGFVAQLIDHLGSELCIDGTRVFAAGFSAGAAMAMALGCAYPDRIAAVAASGGSNLTLTCPTSPPVDTLVLHGSADPIAPPSGSTVPFAPPIGLSVDTVVASTAARAGCDPVPVDDQATATVLVDRYVGCQGGHRVEYWRELGAGHTWAGAVNQWTPLATGIVGPTDTSFNATDEVLDFFARHRSAIG